MVYVTGFWEQGRAAVYLETSNTEQAVDTQATDAVRKEFSSVSEEWSLVIRCLLWRPLRKFSLAGLKKIEVKFADSIYIALFVSNIISKFSLLKLAVKHLSSVNLVHDICLQLYVIRVVENVFFILRYTPINGRCSTYDAWNASSYAWNATWVSSKKDLILRVHTVHFELSEKM